jgi:glycerol kinase
VVRRPAPGLVLALDQGGHGSRAVLFDESGEQVSAAHVPVATRTEGPDIVEQDAEELVRSLELALQDACTADAARGRGIRAAGLATQRSTIVCLKRSTGRPLAAAISWQDRRNAGWLERLRPRATEVRSLTGLVLSPHYGASKMRWCLDHAPAVRAAALADDLVAGPLSSFLLHRLLLERPVVTDPSNASRTLLYDPRRLDWSAHLLQAFGIERRWLPVCVSTHFKYGRLHVDHGETPLTVCTGDQAAAAFAFGPPEQATALVNVGTGAFVQRAAPADAPLPDGLLHSVLRSDGTAVTYSHEGTVNGAGSAIDWLSDRVTLDVDRALRSLSPDPPADAPLFMNGVGGLGAPYWLATFPVEFIGAGDEWQQLTAVVESIAFLLAGNLEVMGRAAPVQRVRISGGLAQCDYLCQALAMTTGLPVDRHAVREATARGLAFLAAGEPDAWRHPTVERTFLPIASPVLAARHARWGVEMARRGATVHTLSA